MTTVALEHRRTADALTIVAAWSLIASAVLQIMLGIPLASLQAQEPPPAIIPVLNSLSHLLQIVGVAGLVRSRAAGQGWLALSGFTLTLVGFGVLLVAETSWLTELDSAEMLFGIATLVLTLGLVVAGVALVRAGRWSGWHRFTLLACGLFVPLVLLPSFALPGLAMHYAIGLWGVCWLLLGLALRAESTTAA